MRQYRATACTLVMLCDERGVPGGGAGLAFQYGSWWVTSVFAAKRSGRGMGRIVLKAAEDAARRRGIRSLRLGTQWTNYPMLWCAIKSGYVLDGCDRNGYVLSKHLQGK